MKSMKFAVNVTTDDSTNCPCCFRPGVDGMACLECTPAEMKEKEKGSMERLSALRELMKEHDVQVK